MIHLMDENSAIQSEDLVLHRDAMKIDHREYHLEPKYISELRPGTPDPHHDSLMTSTATPMIISPVSNTSRVRRVRFVLPTSDIKNVKHLRNIFDDVDTMMIDDDNRDNTEPSIEHGCASDMYWDRNDMKKNRLYAQKKAIIIRNKYPQEVKALERVIIDCCHKDIKKEPQQSPIKRKLFTIIQTEVTTMHTWSSSYVRGLEDFMTPILSEKRCNAIQHILRYQAFLQDQQHSDIQKHLCEYSRKLSQPSRDFALKLAIGDALAASCDP